MKLKINFTFLFILFFGQLFSQNIDFEIKKLKEQKNQIENSIKLKNDSLKSIISKIENLERKLLFSDLNGDESKSIKAIIKLDGKMRDGTSPLSKVITIIKEKDTVSLTDYRKGYWIINKGEYFGYINELFIEQNDKIEVLKKIFIKENETSRLKKIAEEKRKLEIKEKEELQKSVRKRKAYEKSIIKKYGEITGNKLLQGYFWIGMSPEMAKVSLGKPYRVNKSVGTWGINEQWVYNDLYLYFKNGKLTSYQKSE